MRPEDKELLLKDLCARLPYNVWVSYKTKYDDIERATILNGNYVRDIMEGTSSWIDFKPYLRPLSSMTDEEKLEFSLVPIYAFTHYNEVAKMDWFNEHHFDYRDLISRGLAIEVTEDNNPYED